MTFTFSKNNDYPSLKIYRVYKIEETTTEIKVWYHPILYTLQYNTPATFKKTELKSIGLDI